MTALERSARTPTQQLLLPSWLGLDRVVRAGSPLKMRPSEGRRVDERGSVSLEAALVLTVLMVLIVMVIAGGRVALGKIAVDTAAQAGARAASLQRSAGEAQSAAAAAAASSLDGSSVACRPDVATDTSGFAAPVGQPGSVSTTVVCVVELGDLALPGLPGSRTYTATSTSFLDTYRAR